MQTPPSNETIDIFYIKKKVLTFDNWDTAYDLDQESDNRSSVSNLNHGLDNKFKKENSYTVLL